jgi:anti-sigma B factor antagonist
MMKLSRYEPWPGAENGMRTPAGLDGGARSEPQDAMGPPDFALACERLEDGTPVLVLAGELDLYRAPDIEEALAQMIEAAGAEPRALAVDLRSVTFLDSSALAVLLESTRRQRARGRELIVFVGPKTPTTAFEVTGCDRVLAIRRVEGAPA